MRAAALLLVALALAGCTDLRWRKADGDDAQLAQDLSACRKLAQERTARLWGVMPPRTSIDPRYGAPAEPSQADLRLQESQALDACMRARGYVLVPAGR